MANNKKEKGGIDWLDAISENNLERFEKVIRITRDELEVVGINRLTPNKISLNAYLREGFDIEEIKQILNKISKEESNILSISNDDIRREFAGEKWPDGRLEVLNLSKADIDNFILLQTTTLETISVLKQLLKRISKKLHRTKEKIIEPKFRFPFTVPAGTVWEKIIIQFTDSEFVNIQVAGHSHTTGYADMGFVDSRSNRPNLQWVLLLVLAKNGGAITPRSHDAKDNFKKQKQLLSGKLKDYFAIEYDPFKAYERGYEIKMTLIPPKKEDVAPKVVDDVGDYFRQLTEG